MSDGTLVLVNRYNPLSGKKIISDTVNLGRIPCVGEYVMFKEVQCKVKVVVHLGYESRGMTPCVEIDVVG